MTSGEYAYALYDGDTVIAPENYQVTEQANGFTVAVNPAYIPTLTPGGTLKFVYFMQNEKADPTKGFKMRRMLITVIPTTKHHQLLKL